MDNKSDKQFIIMQASIETKKQYMRANKQDYDNKMTKFTEELKTKLAAIKYHINNLKSSPTQKYSQNPPEPITVSYITVELHHWTV